MPPAYAERRCAVCGTAYPPTSPTQTICGRTGCRLARRRQRRAKDHSRTCVVCGAAFTPRHPSNLCCSDDCRGERKRRYHRLWRAAHRESVARSRAKYYDAHPGLRAVEYQRYKTRHLERLLSYWRQRNRRLASESAEVTIATIAAELQRRLTDGR